MMFSLNMVDYPMSFLSLWGPSFMVKNYWWWWWVVVDYRILGLIRV